MFAGLDLALLRQGLTVRVAIEGTVGSLKYDSQGFQIVDVAGPQSSLLVVGARSIQSRYSNRLIVSMWSDV